MTTRIVYVNPGDLIDIRVIKDPELPRNATEWRYQVRPESILMQYQGYNNLALANPAVYAECKPFISKE